MFESKLTLWGAFLCYNVSLAQQLSGSQMWMNYPGLSSQCLQALNTTVSCSLVLNSLSSRQVRVKLERSSSLTTGYSGRLADSDAVNALCADSCSQSLQNARTTIKAACTHASDILVFNQVAYPGRSCFKLHTCH
jgi:hypothetical protein